MGYHYGVVSGRGQGKSYTIDSFKIGQCGSDDAWLQCSGGCNDNNIGGKCTDLFWDPELYQINQYLDILDILISKAYKSISFKWVKFFGLFAKSAIIYFNNAWINWLWESFNIFLIYWYDS